ncbi:hypothetical protein VTK26DRAFT_7030 [Humicola hyalothermophila]
MHPGTPEMTLPRPYNALTPPPTGRSKPFPSPVDAAPSYHFGPTTPASPTSSSIAGSLHKAPNTPPSSAALPTTPRQKPASQPSLRASSSTPCSRCRRLITHDRRQASPRPLKCGHLLCRSCIRRSLLASLATDPFIPATCCSGGDHGRISDGPPQPAVPAGTASETERPRPTTTTTTTITATATAPPPSQTPMTPCSSQNDDNLRRPGDQPDSPSPSSGPDPVLHPDAVSTPTQTPIAVTAGGAAAPDTDDPQSANPATTTTIPPAVLGTAATPAEFLAYLHKLRERRTPPERRLYCHDAGSCPGMFLSEVSKEMPLLSASPSPSPSRTRSPVWMRCDEGTATATTTTTTTTTAAATRVTAGVGAGHGVGKAKAVTCPLCGKRTCRVCGGRAHRVGKQGCKGGEGEGGESATGPEKKKTRKLREGDTPGKSGRLMGQGQGQGEEGPNC